MKRSSVTKKKLLKEFHKQNGSVSAIAVFILIVVIGSMVSVALIMSRSSLSDSNLQNSSGKALFLAESALERVIFHLNDDADCNNLPIADTQTLDGGSFEIVSFAVVTTPDDECDITVKSESNGIVQYIDVKVINNGGTGGGGGGGTGGFIDHFNVITGWTWVPTGAQDGSVGGSGVNCPTATCNGYDGTNIASGGSVYSTITTGGGNREFIGYGEKNLTSNIDTTAGGITLDWSIGFKKNVIGSGGVRQRLKMELYASATGTLLEVWKDNFQDTSNTWTQASGLGLALTDGEVFDQIRLNIELRGRNSRIPEVWLDEVVLSAGGGGGGTPPSWQVVEWQSVRD